MSFICKAISSLLNRNKSNSTSSEETNFKLIKSQSIVNTNNNTNQTPEIETEIQLDQMSQEILNSLITRLESVATRLETIKPTQSNGSSNGTNGNHVDTEEIHPSVLAFDDLLTNGLKPFMTTSVDIGGDVKTIADLVESAFNFERSFLNEASGCTKPSADVLQTFYGMFTKKIDEITSLREKNRKSEFFNHLSAVSESIGALGWVAVSPAPSPFVKEMSDSAQFYTNRVLKDFKEKDARHVQWVKQWIQLLNSLQAYVKEYHTTGVIWNSTKKSRTFNTNFDSQKSNGHSAPKAAGGPPSGPPPPPLPNFTELLADDKPKKSEPKNNNDALFAAINKGTDITSGLKKVSADQMTHKNPNLRQTAVVPGSTPTSNASSTKTVATPVVKPPVFELEDKKWKIEFQNKRNDLVIDQTEIKHTVYIYKCKECTITVKGKVNSILMDNCSRVALLFDDVLSTIEFINCQSVQMQTLGTVPTVCIEKTDGCQVYLSKKSLETEVVSSKSSAMNILVPNGDEFTEMPVPEQYKTVISKNNKLTTFATES
jgi:adenylyl cyclase-associated protein